MAARITVIGAGVIGLTCAVRLAEAGHQVDVMAREMPLETTSAVAGGLWQPYLAEPADLVSRWSHATYRALTELSEDNEARVTGVVQRPGYIVGVAQRPVFADGLPAVGLAHVNHPHPDHRDGWHLTVPVVDMTVHLPYLVRRLEAASGTLTRIALSALPTRGVVINCTGLASRALAADPSVYPVRGQVLRVSNPGVAQWWTDDSDPDVLTYVLPQTRHIVIGGTALVNDFETTPDPVIAEQILERARKLVPALSRATVLSHRVGLRPARPAVRLETVHTAEGTTVHCYGHGGSGVTLAWGCADDVLTEVSRLS
ncbi:FAD-dependent oxidoreductase [Kineosporia sp. NBRC 101731]|uniref:FAD-dependent oxidoreductase n=1 Tax=Kineosporia sp. NBRC 101731 TaxID=3032199 RepID=UPI0024A0298F|nr:FAD-dependent oxidoreductase [Kineosporia sp. NBRC 101731]GLY28032.1 amino acid oxidase [Kineosporia sp. NBRC 101731]